MQEKEQHFSVQCTAEQLLFGTSMDCGNGNTFVKKSWCGMEDPVLFAALPSISISITIMGIRPMIPRKIF
jgi:hypothetical protein